MPPQLHQLTLPLIISLHQTTTWALASCTSTPAVSARSSFCLELPFTRLSQLTHKMADNPPLIPHDQPIDPKRVAVLVHPLQHGPAITCFLKMTSSLGRLRVSSPFLCCRGYCAANSRTRSRRASGSSGTRSCKSLVHLLMRSWRSQRQHQTWLTPSLLYDGHLVHDHDTLQSLAKHGVDDEEIRAGVQFEMNARRESCPNRADAQRSAVSLWKLPELYSPHASEVSCHGGRRCRP